MTDRFHTDFSDLYEALDAALHSVSYAAHLMDIDPSDVTIAGYEQALDYAARVRNQIGERHAADMARRELIAAAGRGAISDLMNDRI